MIDVKEYNESLEADLYRPRTGWTGDEWADFEDWLAIEGFYIKHCTHCDRYHQDDPDKHPSCIIREIPT